MPSELDPAFYQYGRRETPTEGMKRIELEMRDRPDLNPGRIATGAGRTREGYNASIGAQGPVGGGVMVAADPITGQPVMVGGRAQAGPLSYQYNQPAFRGAPASQQVGVGGQPFDADAYFGVTAQQGPGGRSYGANVGQSGEDGGWSAYGQYNPSRRDVNVGGSYTANFATGGRAVVGHATAAGEPVSLETRKGEIRHRQDSGNSRMAADYGYIDTSKPDHDGMKTDAFVGPHRDSKRVFVVNQQHPHTGKFNEHKVLLGYKDRAHALRDYAHSFSDGLGHKRIHSVVEMGTHELKDWLKKPHTEPLKKAVGGPVHMADGGDPPPRPLTIYRGERPKVEAEPETDLYPSQEERPIPMPVPRPDRRPVITPAMLAAQMVPPEEQSPIEGRQAASPSPEGVTSALQGVAEGVSSLYATPQADAAYTTAPPAPVRRPITPQMIAASLNPEAQGAASPSLEGLGQGMVAMGEDPVGLIGGMLPGIGNVMAAADVSKLKDKIAELRASGDEEGATRLQKILPLAAMGAVMPMGAGAATKAAIKGAEKGAAKAAERELSSMGLYSHAAEVAEALPQAKGSPQQMKAMLKGVKQEELAGFDEAFVGQKSVTKDEIAQHFRNQMPVVEETVLGSNLATARELEALKARKDELHAISDNLKDGETLPPGVADEFAKVDDRIHQIVYQGDTRTKFGQHTLPGGENYREVLLKLPEGYGAPKQALDDLAAARQRFKDLDKRHTDELHAGLTGDMNMSYEDFDKLTRERDIAESRVKNFEKLANQPAFQSGHWQDPNVLAHLRMSDRTGPNGEKILHVEEIQSDWGQKGKKEGFVDPQDKANMPSLIKQYDELNAQRHDFDRMIRYGDDADPAIQKAVAQRVDVDNQMQALSDRMTAVRSNIPAGPYVTNTQAWTDLALKRALKEAAEGGYDKLVWTPGAEQAKRYSLSNQVDRLQYIKNDNGTYAVIPYKDDRPLHRIERDNIPDKELDSLFGRDVAAKMRAYEGDVDGNARSLSGQNLEVGGEGMKGYYDKIVPKRLQELIKKHDPEAKLEMGRMPVEGRNKGSEDIARELGMSIQEINALPDAEKRALISSVRNTIAAPSLTITPKMRESILKGQTAFAEGGSIEAPAQGGPVTPESSISNVHRMATEQGLSTRDLSLLIKAATGAPAQWSHGLAGHLLSGDDTFLRAHAAKYPKIAEVISKVNGLLAGKKPSGSARVDRELVHDAIKANKNQNVKKALSTLMQRN
jgi:hypothetical protein